MVEDVDIESLIIDRPIRVGPLELQAALEQSIKDVGIQRPLVARPDHVVLDGVRRLAAAKSLGLTKVPVVVTSDFDLVIETMAATLEDGLHALVADHYRIWYLYQETEPLLGKGRRSRVKITMGMKKVKPKTNSHDSGYSLRYMISKALGSSLSKTQESVFLLGRIFDPNHPDHKHALKVLENVDNGTYTVSYSGERVRALRRAVHSPSYDEQRSILSRSELTLTTAVKALQTIHDIDNRFTAEELDHFIDQFMRDRYKWYQVIKNLRQKRGEKK